MDFSFFICIIDVLLNVDFLVSDYKFRKRIVIVLLLHKKKHKK